MMPCAYDILIIFHLCPPSLSKSHKLIIREVTKKMQQWKIKTWMLVGKVLEGKTDQNSVHTAKYGWYLFVPHPHLHPYWNPHQKAFTPSNTGVNTFSQYCLAMQLFVLLTGLHLHVAANVVTHNAFFLFFHLFGVYVNSLKCTLNFTL